MKRMSIVALFAFALCLLSVAHAKHGGGAAAEQDIMKMEQSLLDALLKGDTTPWEAALGADFVFTAPDGTVQSRADWMADAKSGALKLTSSSNDDMKVHVYGDAAVATYRSTDKGTYKGKDLSGQYRWTDVFIKRGGQWQIVATQGTAIAPK